MKKPKIVVLCGSSRFSQILAACAWLIERDEQAITMGLHLPPKCYGVDFPDSHLVTSAIDELHLRKIDLADEVFVVNYGNYIGKSTKNEIEYAQSHNVPIRWFQHDDIGTKVKALIAAAR